MKPIGSVILACLLITSCFSATVFAQSFDLVLTNGHIIDGTGLPGTPVILVFARARSPRLEILRMPPVSEPSMGKAKW